MATALARILEDDLGLETLIICPKNLVPMWEDYRDHYRLRGRSCRTASSSASCRTCAATGVVIIDESHNLRNREGKRYRAIQEYIQANESKCILLTATPYNKTYLDLANQLRLFIPEDADLGIRPERLLRELGETEFIRRHQAPVRSLAAFEHSQLRRRLARPDAPLPRAADAQLHPGELRRDRRDGRKFLTLRGRHAAPTSRRACR